MARKIHISRMVVAALGLFLGANALVQLTAPLPWYDMVPGVTTTGPFNAHFIRDIGAAYLATAGGLLAFAWSPRAARPALLSGTAFLVVHACIHVFDAVCGERPLHDTIRDFGAVHLVALISLGLALASAPRPEPQPMLLGAH